MKITKRGEWRGNAIKLSGVCELAKLLKNSTDLFISSSDSDHDDSDAILPPDSSDMSPSITKRHVSFLPKRKANLNGKLPNPTSPTTPTATPLSPGTKMRRRRLRTTSRSGDDRISFRGRQPIYTAGTVRIAMVNFAPLDWKVVLRGTILPVKSNRPLLLAFLVVVRAVRQPSRRVLLKNWMYLGWLYWAWTRFTK